ncbi:MAG TPA: hypothetical protein VH678_32935 [Xanthobacteraceae bacterium]|jgi:hypothetical protein
MKSLARPSFFRLFDLLQARSNPGLKLARWTHDGVEFERQRQSFTNPMYGLVTEIVILSRTGRRAWSLMVTKQYWWAGSDGKPFKNMRWARPLSGHRSDLIVWLKEQEKLLDETYQ